MTQPTEAVAIDAQPDRTVARLRGEVDRLNASDIGDTLLSVRTGAALVVDLSETTYLDSAGIAMLEALTRTHTTVLVAPSASVVRRALDVTGLPQVIPVVEHLDEVDTPS